MSAKNIIWKKHENWPNPKQLIPFNKGIKYPYDSLKRQTPKRKGKKT